MTPMLEEAHKLLRVAKADRDVFAYLKPATDPIFTHFYTL